MRWTTQGLLFACLAVLVGAGSCTAATYKQVHRDMVTDLSVGRTAKAAAEAEKFLEQHPGDAESHFILAAAHSQQGDLEKAMGHVNKAVAAGMPLERFLAGPRGLLAPLVESEAFKALAKGKASPLVHGPMVGSATDTSTRFWVRTDEEAGVEVRVRPAGAGGDAKPVVAKGRTNAADDYTVVLEVTGLEPDTAYTYTVHVDGKKMTTPASAFCTFPKAGAPAKFRIVFGGGAGYTPEHEHMWNTIAGRKPLALLMLGDNVYIDTPKVRATQRYCYYRRQSRRQWRGLVGSTAVFSIYDDHDFGTNDCVPGPDIEDPPWKRKVWEVFTQNWANPSYGGGAKQPGCWYTFSIGDVDFFMLDCRYYRTLKSDPPTMLGPVQKAWLKQALAKSTGTFKVLASSVPWAYGSKPGSKDPWQGYKEERKELFDCLAAREADGVLLISADRHRSDYWKIERPGAYDLYEFESSRLTNIHRHGVMKGSIYGYNRTCSFGELEFDTSASDPAVTYRIITIDGKVDHTFEVKRSQLSHGR
ncbi:MAG: alkaline phosphatase D family protein [Phycisphaerae bacterium]